MKLIPFFIILIFVGMVNNTFAVEDNVVIEGNQSPGLYSTELYKIIAEPSDNPRTVELSVYGPIGKIASQKATFDPGGTFVQFFVKFNPPLYKVDEKYAMEISGDGLIGRMNFDLKPAPGGLEKLNERDEANSSFQPSINFRTSNESGAFDNIDNFDTNDKLVISGNIDNFDTNFRFILIDIINPKNELSKLTPIVVDGFGSFYLELDLNGKIWENSGKYKIQLNHVNNQFGEDIVITSSKNIEITQIIHDDVFNSEDNIVTTPSIIPNRVTVDSFPFEITILEGGELTIINTDSVTHTFELNSFTQIRHDIFIPKVEAGETLVFNLPASMTEEISGDRGWWFWDDGLTDPSKISKNVIHVKANPISVLPSVTPQVTPPQVTPPQVEPNFDIIPIAIIIFIFILIIAFLEKIRRRNNKKNIISVTPTIQTPYAPSQVPGISTTRPVTRPTTRPTTNKIQSWRNCKNWPQNTAFSTALQNPSACFSTKKNFSSGKKVDNKMGTIFSLSGAFAIVFKFKIGNKVNALKCFTSKPHGFENQVRISRYLKSKKLDFTITYEADVEIIVQNNDGTQISCPMLVTPWIEGSTLLDYLEQGNLKRVSTISKEFLDMVSQMENHKIAHGDLQSRNIMVQKDLSLKLIDYDGMFIPELRNQPSQESGTLHYQHPLRLKDAKKGGINIFDETMDRFSSIVIYLSLLVLSAKPNLYKKYHDDENIIFKNEDFESPDKSELFKEVSRINNPDIKKLNAELIKYCKSKQLSKIKTVKEILT